MQRFVDRLLAELSAEHDTLATELIEGRVSHGNYLGVVGQLQGLRAAAGIVKETATKWGNDDDDDGSAQG